MEKRKRQNLSKKSKKVNFYAFWGVNPNWEIDLFSVIGKNLLDGTYLVYSMTENQHFDR